MSNRVAEIDEQAAHKLPARLAAQIIERTRQLGLAAGTHLKEQELADVFRVSRTPIRMALHALVELNLVERSPNRGFFLKSLGQPESSPSGLEAAPDGADEDPLYFQVAEDRRTGQLDSRIAEAEIARRYGATKARILRLLTRMAEEGWVTRLPGHGWEFQPFLTSPEIYDQGYRYRMLIEPAALLEPGYGIEPAALGQARAQQLAMVQGGISRWSRSETFAANSVFHEIIVSGASNPFLLEGLRRVNRLRRLLEYRTHQYRGRLVQECKDHLTLLDLIETGRLQKASTFLYEHLDRARIAKRDIIRALG